MHLVGDGFCSTTTIIASFAAGSNEVFSLFQTVDLGYPPALDNNFPAAVVGADALHPKLTHGFLEYSQHRGFITDPARVRHPRDKPHVERDVQYVRERFFKGGEFRDLAHLRDEAAR